MQTLGAIFKAQKQQTKIQPGHIINAVEFRQDKIMTKAFGESAKTTIVDRDGEEWYSFSAVIGAQIAKLISIVGSTPSEPVMLEAVENVTKWGQRGVKFKEERCPLVRRPPRSRSSD